MNVDAMKERGVQRAKEWEEANANAETRVFTARGTLALKALLIACSRASSKGVQYGSLSEILLKVFRRMYWMKLTKDTYEFNQTYLTAWESYTTKCILDAGLTPADESEFISISVCLSNKVWERVKQAYTYLNGEYKTTDEFLMNSLAGYFMPVISTSQNTGISRLNKDIVRLAEMCVRQELGVGYSASDLDVTDFDTFKSLTSDEKIDAFYALALKIYEQTKK